MGNAVGIDVSALKVTAEAPSGVAIITTIDSGENNIVLDSGANACLTAADVREAEALFADASIVLMQLETPVEALVEAAALGKKAGAYVVLNPAPAPKKPLPEALLKNVDLLIPNETEASYIAGIEVKGEDDIPAAMDEIQKRERLRCRHLIDVTSSPFAV